MRRATFIYVIKWPIKMPIYLGEAYLACGEHVDNLSIQERVVFALMAGKTHERLSVSQEAGGQTKGRWSTQNFFTRNGIIVSIEEKEEEIYLPNSSKANPNRYGYRVGSLSEIRNKRFFNGPFGGREDAEQHAQKRRDDVSVGHADE